MFTWHLPDLQVIIWSFPDPYQNLNVTWSHLTFTWSSPDHLTIIWPFCDHYLTIISSFQLKKSCLVGGGCCGSTHPLLTFCKLIQEFTRTWERTLSLTIQCNIYLVNDLRQGSNSFLILYDKVLLLSVMQAEFRIGIKIIVMILSMFHKIFSHSEPSIIPEHISL